MNHARSGLPTLLTAASVLCSVPAATVEHRITSTSSLCPGGSWDCSASSTGLCCKDIDSFAANFAGCLAAGDELLLDAEQEHRGRLDIEVCPDQPHGGDPILIRPFNTTHSPTATILESVRLSDALPGAVDWTWRPVWSHPGTGKRFDIRGQYGEPRFPELLWTPVWRIDLSSVASAEVAQFHYEGRKMRRASHRNAEEPNHGYFPTAYVNTSAACSQEGACQGDSAAGGCVIARQTGPMRRLCALAHDGVGDCEGSFREPHVYVVMRPSGWDVEKLRVSKVCTPWRFSTAVWVDGAGQQQGILWHYPHNLDGWGFYVHNSLVYLDEPGEWYYHPGQQHLYFWPPESSMPGPGLQPSKALSEVTFATGAGLTRAFALDVDMNGHWNDANSDDVADHYPPPQPSEIEPNGASVRISNLKIRYPADGGIRVGGWGTDVTLEDVAVEGSAGHGILVKQMLGLADVSRARVFGASRTGIRMYDVREAQVRGGTVVDGLENVDTFWAQGVGGFQLDMHGIWIHRSASEGVCRRAGIWNTTVRNSAYAAIGVGSFRHEANPRNNAYERVYVAKNTIEGYAQLLNDVGAIHVSAYRRNPGGAGYVSEELNGWHPGRNIRWNKIRNGGPNPRFAVAPGTDGDPIMTPGVYLEWHSSSYAVYENLISDTHSTLGDIYVNGGNWNRIHHHLLDNSRIAVGLSRAVRADDNTRCGKEDVPMDRNDIWLNTAILVTDPPEAVRLVDRSAGCGQSADFGEMTCGFRSGADMNRADSNKWAYRCWDGTGTFEDDSYSCPGVSCPED